MDVPVRVWPLTISEIVGPPSSLPAHFMPVPDAFRASSRRGRMSSSTPSLLALSGSPSFP